MAQETKKTTEKAQTPQKAAADISPDFAAAKTSEPTGRQAEAAEDTEGISASLIPSPTGPQPVSAVAATPEAAEKLIAERKKRLDRERDRPSAYDKLSEKQIRELNAPTLRAIARQRGYRDFPQGGRRTSQDAFIRLQGADKALGDK